MSVRAAMEEMVKKGKVWGPDYAKVNDVENALGNFQQIFEALDRGDNVDSIPLASRLLLLGQDDCDIGDLFGNIMKLDATVKGEMDKVGVGREILRSDGTTTMYDFQCAEAGVTSAFHYDTPGTVMHCIMGAKLWMMYDKRRAQVGIIYVCGKYLKPCPCRKIGFHSLLSSSWPSLARGGVRLKQGACWSCLITGNTEQLR